MSELVLQVAASTIPCKMFTFKRGQFVKAPKNMGLCIRMPPGMLFCHFERPQERCSIELYNRNARKYSLIPLASHEPLGQYQTTTSLHKDRSFHHSLLNNDQTIITSYIITNIPTLLIFRCGGRPYHVTLQGASPVNGILIFF